MDRESIEFDVLFVGGGVSSLAGAIRLLQMAEEKLMSLEVAVIEKGSEIGAHGISGAVMNPIALQELLPDYQALKCPLEQTVRGDGMYYLTRRKAWRVPLVPRQMHNQGFAIISLAKFTRWLGEMAEEMGVNIFPGFAGREVLYGKDGKTVIGVRTGDNGRDADGQEKSNFEPGIDILAQVTVFGEGARGSLSKSLIDKLALDRQAQPQVYETGIKEVIQLPEENFFARSPINDIHTMGYPLGLDIPGGYYTMPQLATDGAVLIGAAAGIHNTPALKGIHVGMKSGMLAAEAIVAALAQQDVSAASLERYGRCLDQSWVHPEIYEGRNFAAALAMKSPGKWFHLGAQYLTKGRGIVDPLSLDADFAGLRPQDPAHGPATPGKDFDNHLMVDRLTGVYLSKTQHREDQPSHLVINDPHLCIQTCYPTHGSPCTRFCPASVYEIETDPTTQAKRLKLNPSNCLHCKTCDIKDPYQNIDWICPEGGGGPGYTNV